MKSLLSRLLVATALVMSAAGAAAGPYEDFFIAVRNDNASAVRALLQRGFDVNTRGPDGLPGLILALREPSPKVSQMLLDWPNVDIEARSAQDESPLMIAALKGERDIAEKLIARDAAVNKTGWTPLHYAATGGHLALIRLLLDNSAYIDAESPNGSTPLMMAARYGAIDGARLLLEEGADPTIKNEQGLTAADFARAADRASLVDDIDNAIRTAPATHGNAR
ncbi:MAG: ankyrin repeat domain-containing protein [Burkholderiales bacterium]